MAKKSETLSITVPEVLKLELSAIPKTGYYDSVSEFLRDAMRSLLDTKKELRIAIAVVLYKEEKISLGRAVEIAGVNYEEMKKILWDKGVVIRRGASNIKEVKARLKRFEKWKKGEL